MSTFSALLSLTNVNAMKFKLMFKQINLHLRINFNKLPGVMDPLGENEKKEREQTTKIAVTECAKKWIRDTSAPRNYFHVTS